MLEKKYTLSVQPDTSFETNMLAEIAEKNHILEHKLYILIGLINTTCTPESPGGPGSPFSPYNQKQALN